MLTPRRQVGKKKRKLFTHPVHIITKKGKKQQEKCTACFIIFTYPASKTTSLDKWNYQELLTNSSPKRCWQNEGFNIYDENR